MKKLLKIVMTAAAMIVVASCGGGGGSTSPFGSNTPPGATSSAAAIDVLASALQVQSAGDQVTITAIVKDSGNASLPSTPVTFAADSGTLTSAATVTDSAGVATAVLSAGANRSNRALTVTVRSGGAESSIVLPVTGTTFSYTGQTTVALTQTVPTGITAVDSKGVPITGLAVSVSSSLNNGLSATSATTDAQGSASINYTATNAGADTLTFTGGGVTLTKTVLISADNFSFVDASNNALPAGMRIPVGSSQSLSVRYLVNGVPQVGKSIQFTSTAGAVSPSMSTTNSNGVASASISSNTASPATVQATVVGATAQVTLPIVFSALAPSAVTVQVAPTAIGPNIGTATSQQARVVASAVDVNGNPVAGATINFIREVDPSGGNLSQPSAVTDSSGQATVQYIAGASTTASNGVRVRAEVAGSPSVFGRAELTVNRSALFIALGTGNTISNIDEQTYRKDWVVYVTDSNGIAVPNITLTIKVLPLLYGKGSLGYSDADSAWVRSGSINCANEDNGGSLSFRPASPTPVNTPGNAYNGVLDAYEDMNHDGRLQPGNVISVTAAGGTNGSSVGTFTTDSTGRATISLIYAESYVPWLKVRLSASAIVSGTESSTQSDFFVSGASADFTSKAVPPAGVQSPFGVVTVDGLIGGPPGQRTIDYAPTASANPPAFTFPDGTDPMLATYETAPGSNSFRLPACSNPN